MLFVQLYFIINCLKYVHTTLGMEYKEVSSVISTYEESPRESTSRVSMCHFFGDLSSLSSASIMCNQAEILICWSLTLLEYTGHLWSWARFMAAQILTINFVNRASMQNLWPKFERP